MKQLAFLLMLAVVAALVLSGCGGGGGTEITPPAKPDPGDQGAGGDPTDQIPIGLTEGAFQPPNGTYGDLRGVAVSTDHVYVADSTTLYAYDMFGNYINQINPPATIQAIDVFPPTPDVDATVKPPYTFGGFVAVLHNPVSTIGYISVYAPGLDPGTTVEDGTAQDIPRQFSLPNDVDIEPHANGVSLLPPWSVPTVYDLKIDRFGAILCTVDVQPLLLGLVNQVSYVHALQILSPYKNYAIERTGTVTGQDENGDPVTATIPCYDDSQGFAVGETGSLAVDTFFPFNRQDAAYTLYMGDANLLTDYVGVSEVSLNLNNITPTYVVSPAVDNGFGYVRVIGGPSGAADGSFSPDASPADPDLTNGGPSGMGIDWLSDELYVCDPGNNRIQVFYDNDATPGNGYFKSQLGPTIVPGGLRAPSSVATDMLGNVYICDVNTLYFVRGNYPQTAFGNVGGTVSRLSDGSPLEGATVALGNESGTVDSNFVRATTNINGDYLFNNVLVGTYYISASKFRFDTDNTSIQILPDTTVRADFNLRETSPHTFGSYTGSVIDANTNFWLEGVTVSIVGTSLTATTDFVGRFVINNIPPGTWQVTLSLAGYDVLSPQVEILAGSTTNGETLKMKPSL